MANVPITPGTGVVSVAAELVSGLSYQRIEVLGSGGASVLGVNPDGSIKASIIGVPMVFIGGGSITTIGAGVANQSVSGAVTTPPGSITTVVNPAGSVTTVIATAPPGSIMATTAPAGSIIAVTGTVTAPAGSVLTTAALAGSVMAVSGTFTTPAGSIQSITHPAGSITAVRTDSASVITTQVAGSVLAVSGTFTTPAGSIQSITNPAGSVTAVRTDSASVITTQPSGSVMAVGQSGTWKTSIASNYASGAASVVSAIGNLMLGVRNDTLSSLLALSDGQYTPWTVGPAGENVVANSPLTKWIQGTGDLRTVQGASVQILAAQGTSIFTYVTGAQLASLGPNSVLVTFTGGLGSILGYTIAPAGGGSNIVYTNALKTGANSGFSASLSGTASVLISLQGFISKT